MYQLTDTQRLLLSDAARRNDGIIDVSKRLTGAAARRAGEKLLRLGLAAERTRRPKEPIWREDDVAGPIALVVTAAGLAAIGIADDATSGAAPPEHRPVDLHRHSTVERAEAAPRPGTKKAAVLALLAQADGVDLAAIADATGWLPHTASAMLTGLRKAGTPIETIRTPGARARYRLAGASGGEARAQEHGDAHA